MFKEFKKEIDFGGQSLILETGKIARQADGAVGRGIVFRRWGGLGDLQHSY